MVNKEQNDSDFNKKQLTLTAMLAEYNTLRNESLNTIGHRLQIITITFAALSAVIAGLFARQIWDILAGVVALLIIPQLSKAAIFIWLGEYSRSMRAGRWIADLEQRINKLIDSKEAIGWELELIKKGRHMGYPYLSVISLLLGSGYIGTALGVYFLSVSLGNQLGFIATVFITIGLIFYAFTIETWFVIFCINEWKRITRKNLN